MAIPQHDTNLRRRRALLRELADLVDDLLRGGLEPGWRSTGVGDGGGADALAVAVHATHDCGTEVVVVGVGREFGDAVRWSIGVGGGVLGFLRCDASGLADAEFEPRLQKAEIYRLLVYKTFTRAHNSFIDERRMQPIQYRLIYTY